MSVQLHRNQRNPKYVSLQSILINMWSISFCLPFIISAAPSVMESWRARLSSAASPSCILSLIHATIFYWYTHRRMQGHVRKACVIVISVYMKVSVTGCEQNVCIHVYALLKTRDLYEVWLQIVWPTLHVLPATTSENYMYGTCNVALMWLDVIWF